MGGKTVYAVETTLSYVAEGEANGLTNSFMDYGSTATMASQGDGKEEEQRYHHCLSRTACMSH